MHRHRASPDFDEFARQQTPGLLVLARAMTGNHHDAWDLVQEALVRMAERWGRSSFDVPEAYVRTVMVRLNIDRFRRLRREIVQQSAPHEETDPEVHLRDTPLAGWLVEGLALLSPKQRTAVALRFVGDASMAEIADHLGCSEGTARSHVSRGLSRLREALPPQWTAADLPSTPLPTGHGQ